MFYVKYRLLYILWTFVGGWIECRCFNEYTEHKFIKPITQKKNHDFTNRKIWQKTAIGQRRKLSSH